ncbi:LacI family DNA-binding transcriptional regulator [Rhodoplanes roseus]|uniref:GntR family transcriptional regulator n=1 Tax=Rhodoplanes roseus TaxID=29409 RepID=A0A327KYW3_9BRAD|nr:LacI family DNA-binding transcriptional regulator [Rhodoplanes roseus]RAI43297.1 GntR family transcriptional regulator [Rhodoplanes roseus]
MPRQQGASPSSTKAATLHDVARVAGVSLITASRALTKPSLVSDTTIERVQAAVQATGYIPNLLAGSLKSSRSRLIAGLVPALSVAQFLPTLQALTDVLDAAGYQLMLGQMRYDNSRQDALLNAMISRRVDGIVVTGLIGSEAVRRQVGQLGIPVVETWDLPENPTDMVVGFSHTAVGRAVAAYLVGKGYGRIGLATGDDHRAQLRRQGLLAGLGREVPTATVPAPSSLALGRRALGELLQQDPALRAVACSADQLAQGVVVEALARGLRVPEDLAVCGFGNADFSAHTVPTLTTVRVDGAAIGRRAGEMILARCRGETVPDRIVDVGFAIAQRESA